MGEIIELDKNALRQLQLIELEMLIEIDRICRKHGIKEYEKFFEVCRTELDQERFFFQDYRTDPGYRWGYGKLRRKGTEYVKSGQEMLSQKTGICIDIFDFEYLPDDEKKRRKHMREMFCIRKALYSAMGRKNEKSPLLRAWYSLLYLIPKDTLFKLKNNICRKYDEAHTKRVLCMMWPTSSVRDGYPRSLFDDYIDLEFEGMSFMAAKGYKEILAMHYGDYMILPPEAERKGVMNAVKLSFVNVQYEDLKNRYERENI